MDLNEIKTWTALVTPLLENGEIDFPSLEKLLKAQINAHNGILLLGSTGEALNLSLKERKEVLEFSLPIIKGHPTMVGVGGQELEATKEWVEYLNTLDIHCMLMVVPLYAKPQIRGQYHWFKTLMDTSKFPVMLYNVPGRSAKSLEYETVEMLSDHPNFWAIKEASGSVADFEKYVSAAKGKAVYSGDDALLCDFVPVGAKGLVSVAGNVWPTHTHKYTNLALMGELDNEEVDLWKKSSLALFCASNPIPTKCLLKETGVINSPHCKLPLHIDDMADMKIVMDANTNILNWKRT